VAAIPREISSRSISVNALVARWRAAGATPPCLTINTLTVVGTAPTVSAICHPAAPPRRSSQSVFCSSTDNNFRVL
jgi:hypothetical protein